MGDVDRVIPRVVASLVVIPHGRCSTTRLLLLIIVAIVFKIHRVSLSASHNLGIPQHALRLHVLRPLAAHAALP